MSEVPPLGALVELRPGMEKFYNGAVGWRAIVKDHRVDDGFDQIYVEWDREYWRYDPAVGQADGWTYPAHFSMVGQISTTPEEFAAEMVAESERRPEEPEHDEHVCEDCGEDHRPAYAELLNEAAAEAADGEGFALIFVRRDEDSDEYVLYPHMISGCLTDEAEALIEAMIVQAAQQTTNQWMMDYLRKFG